MTCSSELLFVKSCNCQPVSKALPDTDHLKQYVPIYSPSLSIITCLYGPVQPLKSKKYPSTGASWCCSKVSRSVRLSSDPILRQPSYFTYSIFGSLNMAPRIMVSNEVYILPLKDNGAPDVPGEYIYLATKTQEPVTIRFTIEGTSSICRQGSLWVNIPEKGSEFHRNQFREYK